MIFATEDSSTSSWHTTVRPSLKWFFSSHMSAAGIDERMLIRGEWLWHVNKYTRLKNVSAFESTSSDHRAAVFASLGAPRNADEVAKLLGDTSDPQWPIYRTATPPDSGLTMATAIFDLHAGMVTVWSFTNPASTDPVAAIEMLPICRPSKGWIGGTVVFGVLSFALAVGMAILSIRVCLRHPGKKRLIH